MAQRNIEIVIGRLITDEGFRRAFLRDPKAVLLQFVDAGYLLTPLEIAAVMATRPQLWTFVAEEIDPRLQKASFDCQ